METFIRRFYRSECSFKKAILLYVQVSIVYYPFVHRNTPPNAAGSPLIVLMGVASLYQERRYV